MKKLTLSVLGIAFAIGLSAQAVVDNAVIPVSVSLNSILRLNVTSGGAIEFNVNSMNQYRYGIENTTRYTTVFTVASSVDFDVFMYAENDALYGTQMGTAENTFAATDNSMPLDLIGYTMVSTGSGTAGAAGTGANWGLLMDDGTVNGAGATLNVLSNVAATKIVESNPADGTDLGGAGGSDQNKFEIQWELATTGVQGINTNGLNLLEESLEPDRYATNVFLELRKQP
ncbi:MAG: hypothetical protein AB7S69_17615 [Salinivirgaceae bacterium]